MIILVTMISLFLLSIFFWIGIKITGGILAAFFWLVFKLPAMIFFFGLGLVFMASIIFIPLGLLCFKLAGSMVRPVIL